MPDRIIKESICTSDTLNQLSDFEERFWNRLIVNCDDYGRFDARVAILKGRLFPLMDGKTLKNITDALQTLASVGLVKLYEVDGKPFLQVVTWEKHQRVRAKRSKFPPPADIGGHLPSNAVNSVRNPIQSESKSESKAKASCAGYVPALQAFVAMREQYGKPMGRDAIELLQIRLEHLAPGDKEKQEALLKQSVVKGWMDVYPIDGGPKKKEEENAKNAAASYGQRGIVL